MSTKERRRSGGPAGLTRAGVVTTYGDKIIGVDPAAAALAGQLEAKAISTGHDPGMADATIAGIAQAHDLVVIAHNTKHCPDSHAGGCRQDIELKG